MNTVIRRIKGFGFATGAAVVLSGLIAAPTLAGDAGGAAPDEGTATGRPTQCLRISLIQKTKVVDDQTILFFMPAGKTYRATLDKPCPNLKFEDQWTYSSATNSLCPGQIITVRRRRAGGMAGASCAIKRLERYVEADAPAKDSQ